MDADLKREWISMTTDTLRREEIIVEMEEELDKTDREKLENLFFLKRDFSGSTLDISFLIVSKVDETTINVESVEMKKSPHR